MRTFPVRNLLFFLGFVLVFLGVLGLIGVFAFPGWYAIIVGVLIIFATALLL